MPGPEKCEWLTDEAAKEIAELLQSDPRAGRMKLARLAAAQVKPSDEAWQAAFALNVEAHHCVRNAEEAAGE